jgi:leader peptidase (prepilin peptidase) / N-methyltransferase
MPWFSLVVLFIFGLVFGSFFNVLIYRLPRDLSVVHPGSRCPQCDHPIRWYDNIPLLSYVLLGAKCRHCGARISMRYPLVELAGGLIFAGVPWLGSAYGYTRVLVEQVTPFHHGVAIVCVSVFFLVLVIDFEHKMIPDQLNIALFAAAWLAVVVLRPGFSPGWASSVIGMFLLSLFFFIFALAIGGFGMGDVKMALGLGVLFGWQQLLVVAMLSFIIGGLAAIGIATRLYVGKKRKARTEIPFGPYLSLGAAIALFTAAPLLDWYLSFFGR